MENPFNLLMHPKSIATVGAGNNLGTMGNLSALNIIKGGYKGMFFPVHPKEKKVIGCKAYPSVFDLPETPDLAMLIVNSDQVVQLLEDFGKIGTKRAIICSGGFKEIGIEGKKREDQLNEIANKYDIRFVGPNCVGIINSQSLLNTTVMPISKKPGMLGFASQSGTFVAQILGYLKKRDIRVSKSISVGNEANIDIVDALEFLGKDEQTKAIALYIEGIRNGRRFLEVVREITPYKPVVAQYVGGSEAGARAGSSHTGALAGPDALYEGIFKQAGIIRVHSVEELYDYGWALATQPPLKGKRIGIITNSGGPGTAMSHVCNNGGLDVPRFSNDIQREIRKHIPYQAASDNPIDLTFVLDPVILCTTLPELLMKSDEVDGILMHEAMETGMMKEIYPAIREMLNNTTLEDLLERIKPDLTTSIALPWKYNKPLLVSTFFDRDDSSTVSFQDNNIPVYHSPEKAARAMLTLFRYMKIRERKKMAPLKMPEMNYNAKVVIEDAMKKGQKSLDEHEAKQILSAYGIPVTKEKVVLSEKDALDFASSIGFPVVLKGCASDIIHKTEKGLVHININNEDGVRRSFNAIKESAGADIPVLVQAMVSGSREFVAGMTRFPGFGPCLLFGMGGIFAEVINDTTFRSAPLSTTEAFEMIQDINSSKLLKAIRGMPPVDISILTDLLQKLGFISLLHPEIAEADLNPIVVNGSKPVVVDALFVLS